MLARIPLNSLVNSALVGDGAAWRQLADRLYPWALRLAGRRLPRGLSPEDAVQEAFLTAFQKLPDLRTHESLPAWLAAIIGSHCLRQTLNRPKECSLEQMAEAGLLPPDRAQSPEDALCATQLLAACDAALDELPGHLRDVCRLHYRRGMSIPEVAQACGLPEGTVKKRLFTARPFLRQRLARFRGESLFRVGYMPLSDHLLAMCADSLSQGRDLPLLSRRYQSWAVLAADLKRGRLDAAFIMAPLALSLRQAGTPLLYVMDGHHDGSALTLSRRAERRQRIGLPGQHSTHGVLLHRLTLERPEFSGQPTLVVNPSSVISSMRQNEIGSFLCGEPWSAKCAREGLGDTVLRSRDISPGHLCCILAVNQHYAERNGQVVADYVRTLLKARDRVLKNPAFGAGVQAAYTGIEASVALQVLDEHRISFDDLEPDEGRLADFARQAEDCGVLSGPCGLEGFSCRDFYAQASA